MSKEESYNKIERFFKRDLEIKKLLNNIIPIDLDFYNEQSKIEYLDRLINGIRDIEILINQIIDDFKLSTTLKKSFQERIKAIKKEINSTEFYKSLNAGLLKTLQYIKTNISNLDPGFVESLRKGFKGYYLFYGENVIEPKTINEFLHYIHSYIINNEKFYEEVPVIQKSKENQQEEWEGLYLRGTANDLGVSIYNQILNDKINSDRIDIISLPNKILIMARDLGHATVIEIDTTDKEKIFVRYFIPKNNNIEMTANLKGINVNHSEFAVGDFLTNSENLSSDMTALMRGIATDLDRSKKIEF